MSFVLQFSKQAEQDLIFHKKSGNKLIIKKIISLLEEIVNHPYIGTGKPEALKYDLTGKWSRRIDQKHRIIYEVVDLNIKILSVRGHYL